MDMDQSAVFLAGSILTMLGFIIFVIGVVIINNIIHAFWKPVRIFTEDSFGYGKANARFATEEEITRIAPSFDKSHKGGGSNNELDLSKNK
jgi:hypothetical protein